MNYEDIKVGERYVNQSGATVTVLAKAQDMVFVERGSTAYSASSHVYSYWKPLPKEHKGEVWVMVFVDEEGNITHMPVKYTEEMPAVKSLMNKNDHLLLAVKRIPFTVIEGEFDE